MILEFYGPGGEFITETEISDEAFQRAEVASARQGISVQQYILNLLHDHAAASIKDEQDNQEFR